MALGHDPTVEEVAEWWNQPVRTRVPRASRVPRHILHESRSFQSSGGRKLLDLWKMRPVRDMPLPDDLGLPGAVGSLLAPWAHWGVEKRRLQWQARSGLLSDIRTAMETGRDPFATPAYGRVRPHLEPTMREIIERPRTMTITADDVRQCRSPAGWDHPFAKVMGPPRGCQRRRRDDRGPLGGRSTGPVVMVGFWRWR
jgi:hypothetical protein